MGRLKPIFLFLLILWLASPNLHAEVYQWTDQDGITHASSDLQKIPAPYRGNAEVISATAGRGETAEEYFVPFEKGASGIILVQVFLNDSIRARMVLDTGASLVLISDELAGRMDRMTSSSAEGKIRLKTAGGDVEGRSISIDKVELGDAVRENVRAAVSHQKAAFDGFDGLLGLSFLEGFNVTIDHQNRQIILRKP
ncbi:MAG: retroviral-like aspartic protease family protein [Deltaproteobacteria bacterium]|nr:retroviral-like aspartic protease family protein [Deltaproteobacteria bacterium]